MKQKRDATVGKEVLQMCSDDLTLSETLPLVFRSFFFLYQTNVPSLYSSTNTFCHDSPIKPSTEQQYSMHWTVKVVHHNSSKQDQPQTVFNQYNTN